MIAANQDDDARTVYNNKTPPSVTNLGKTARQSFQRVRQVACCWLPMIGSNPEAFRNF